jgi:hypothetical protein
MALAALAVALEAFMVLAVLADGIKLEAARPPATGLEVAGFLVLVDMIIISLAAVVVVAAVGKAQILALLV